MFTTSAKYIPPKKMAALAAQITSSSSTIKCIARYAPSKSPRSQQELIAAILNNQSVRPLEWNLLCRRHELWNHDKAEEIALKICPLLKSSSRLDKYISQEFVHALTDEDKAQYFQSMFKMLLQKKPVGINSNKWQFLYRLSNQNSLATLCQKELFEKNPSEPYRLQYVLECNGLEATQNLKYHIAKELPKSLIKHPAFQPHSQEQGNRDYILQRVLDALFELNDEQRFSLTEQLALITHKTKQQLRGEYFQRLAHWVTQHYGPKTNPKQWRQFSSKARETLSHIMGETTYKFFGLIIDEICKAPSLNATEKPLLYNRKKFWQSYQHNFLSIRILVSSTTYSILQDKTLKQHASPLIEDNSPATEVCIFELEKYFIVEFMRGQGKEGRIFEANKGNRNTLLNDKLSVSKIRSLPSINKYDHCYLWQPYLHQTLHELGIKHHGHIPESKKTSDADLENRTQQLTMWRKTLAKLEST